MAQAWWPSRSGGALDELRPCTRRDVVGALERQLPSPGKEATFTIHPGTEHACRGRSTRAGDGARVPGTEHACCNDSRPEVYNAGESEKLWRCALAFFWERL